MARVFGYRCLQVECFKRNVAPRTIEADIFEISVCEPVVHSQRGWSHSSVPAGRRKFYGFAGDNIVHDESIPYRWPLRNFDLPLNLQNAFIVLSNSDFIHDSPPYTVAASPAFHFYGRSACFARRMSNLLPGFPTCCP